MGETIMTKLIWAGAAALLMTAAAVAEPVTTTYTIDNDKISGTKTVTRDQQAGTVSKDSELTRLSDGAVATREYDRARTESGWAASGSTTRFNGDTRSFENVGTRNQNGYTAEGSVTGYNGQAYGYDARGHKTGNGYVRHQTLTNQDGKKVAGRHVVVNQNGRHVVTRGPRRRGN
jgi:hypothetical protein